MQNDGSGDMTTPYSMFTDLDKLATVVKEKARVASPATVTNIIALPNSHNKKALKTYLRDKLFAANHDIRSVLYKSLIKRIECNQAMFCEELYLDYERDHFTDATEIKDIPLPEFVQYDNIPFYYLNEKGKLTVFKILACIGYRFPQVSYSPLLPAAISLLLHYDDNPAQVFMHVCRLIFSVSKSTHYLDITKAESDASSLVLKDLSQRFTPSSHKSLLNLTSDTLTVYKEWIRCLFLGLPFSFVVILFDMYLLEGYKALYRVSLAILKYYRKVGVSNASDIVSAVFQFVQHLEMTISIPLLFRKAFGFKLPPSKEIKKLQKRIKSTFNNLQSFPNAEKKPHRNPWDYLSIVRDIKSEIVDETSLSTLYCSIPEKVALYKPKVIFSTSTNGYNMQTFFSCVEDYEPTLLLIKTISDEVLGAFLSAPWNERRDSIGFFGTGETFVFSLLPEAKIFKWVVLQEKVAKEDNYDGVNQQQHVLPPVKPPGGANKGGKGVTLPPIHYDPPVTASMTSVPKLSQEPVIFPPLVGTSCAHPVVPPPERISTGDSLQNQMKNDMFMMADETGLVIGGGKGYGIFVDAGLHKGHSQHCTTFNNEPLVSGGSFTCATVEVIGFNTI